MSILYPDICIIGAGAAGLSVAAGAAQLGLDVVLVEAGAMGGDCLNHGCVPSKALIHAAKQAHLVRHAGQFGIETSATNVDWAKIKAHITNAIDTIAPNDSVERFEGLGVRVMKAHGKFTDKDTLVVDGIEIKARRFVISTGSKPFVPPIDGLAASPFLTNETIFHLDELPASMAILGAGPIGLELGQAFARLGVKIHLIERAEKLLPEWSENARTAMASALKADNVNQMLATEVTHVAHDKAGFKISLVGKADLKVQQILVATGRAANVANMSLDAAGVTFNNRGIETDTGLHTSNRKIWALGDVSGRGNSTHQAGQHASIFIKQALFKLPAKVPNLTPATIFTDPELARIGLSLDQALKTDPKAKLVSWSAHENDRAITEANIGGGAYIVVGAKGQILGAEIFGPNAADQLFTIQLLMDKGQKIGTLANGYATYPIRTEMIKRAASSYFTPKLFSGTTRKIVNILKRFGR